MATKYTRKVKVGEAGLMTTLPTGERHIGGYSIEYEVDPGQPSPTTMQEVVRQLVRDFPPSAGKEIADMVSAEVQAAGKGKVAKGLLKALKNIEKRADAGPWKAKRKVVVHSKPVP